MTECYGQDLLIASDLIKIFKDGDGRDLLVLNGLNLEVSRNEVVAIVGSSGSGKSTLLQILGGLDTPTSGQVSFDGKSITESEGKSVNLLRNREIGFVFQFHHLLKDFSALENVMIPAMIDGDFKGSAEIRAKKLLAQVGLDHRLHHKPSELSGGEQQRVAVARALCNRPKLLLADEPSGNLDSQTSEELHQVLFELRDEGDLAMVIVTHSKKLAAMTDRVLQLSSGKLRQLTGKVKDGQ